jgi:hypothetical protein
MASVASERPLPGTGGPASETFLEAMRELQEAAYQRAVEGPGLHVLAPLLRGRMALRPHTVDLAVDALARDAAHVLLTHGWTPSELYAFAQRRLDATAMNYLVDILAAASHVTVAAPWYDEVAALGGQVWWSVSRPHLAQWAARHAHKRVETIRAAVEVLALLCHVPRTDEPLPGSPEPLQLEPGTLVHDERIAGKIDALLARAADSSFPEEAKACAAKAQELMVRYATVPDVAPVGPVAGAAAAAMDQLITEGPAVVAKTLFAGVRFGVSILADPVRFAGNVGDEVAHLFQRLAAVLGPVVPALPGLPGRSGHRALDSTTGPDRQPR